MSWYFLGGFSAYWMVPSGRFLEPRFVFRHVGMVGRGLEGDVERDGDVVSFAASRRSVEVVDRAEFGED